MISGGAGQHDLICQLLADATDIPVIATRAEEPVFTRNTNKLKS